MLTTVLNTVLLFFLFSMIGWTIESTYRSLGERKIINSGFLYGPMCPIYGTGALVFHVCLLPLKEHWWVVLLLGMVLADTVEYLTSVIMEKLFHARWWDYTDEFMNLNGRICLKHTAYWAVFSLLYVYVIAPVYEYLISFIPQNLRYVMIAVIFTVFIIDLIFTVKAALDIQKVIRKTEELRQKLMDAAESVKTTAENLKDDAALRLDDLQASIAETGDKLNQFKQDIVTSFNDLSARFEDLKNGQKSENYSTRTKRLFTSSGSIRKTAEHLMHEIEEKANELKDRLEGKDGKK